jgi:outer membrane protein assembly factor BamB
MTYDFTSRKPLRLWPGLVAAALLLAARFGVKAVIPGFAGFRIGMLWSFGAAGVVLLWWLLLSRTRWFERVGALVLMIGGLGAAWYFRHPSMGPAWLFAYAVPGICLALVAGAAAGRRLADAQRRAAIAAAILFASGAWLLVRTEGINGDHNFTFGWRWTPSPEERLLARSEPVPAPPAATAENPPREQLAVPAAGERPSNPKARDASKERLAAPPAAPGKPEAAPSISPPPKKTADWPGFRGPNRDGIVRGVRINTDWASAPPVAVWRRPVGPGWSSFASDGDVLYTQEQRGEDEMVAAYKVATGQPVWAHRDAVRFFEANGGPGPRGTPTLTNGRVYTFGATGIMNALDARTGAVVWSRDAASDSEGTASMAGGKRKIPDWGFSSSPLVVGDVVVVAVAGQLVAYDVATGKPRWSGPAGGVSYSSPQLVTIGGVQQVVLLSATGAASFAPDGKRLWEHPWNGFPIVQPAVTADGDLLIAAGAESGIRRIKIAHGPEGWTAERRWGSPAMKPYFNDFVVHKGHAYGFDGRILACVNLEDGHRAWKGGRYGNGQLVLLPEQDVLLVLSEEGELALVGATPDGFKELAHVPALEGKTWNHPALVGDVLLVRNDREMAAFRLTLAGR